MSAQRLDVSAVSLNLGGRTVVEDASLAVRRGEMVGIVGRNGSGKSTLLKAVYRSLRPASGTVGIDGADLWAMPVRHAARLRSAVTQLQDASPDLTVAETVLTGRTAHLSPFDRTSPADREHVASALDRVRMGWAVGRTLGTLSGGERQRVLIARALAQQSPFVVLDEPTNHLDVGAALEVLELVRDLGLGVLAALHDLDHAAAYCDRLVVLRGGRVVAAGPPPEVLTPDLVAEVFGVRAVLGTNPLTGRPSVTVGPLGDGREGTRASRTATSPPGTPNGPEHPARPASPGRIGCR